MADHKNFSTAEWMIFAGIFYISAVFIICKYIFDRSAIVITIYEQYKEVPFSKVYLLFLLTLLAIGIIYHLYRKNSNRNININGLLVGLQVFFLSLSATIYFIKINLIVDLAIKQVNTAEQSTLFPYDNNFELIWSAPTIWGKAIVILTSAGIILLPLIIGFSFYKR